MPRFFAGSGKWRGGNTPEFERKKYSVCTREIEEFDQVIKSDSEEITMDQKQPIFEEEKPKRQLSVKKRKFSFRKGKVSVHEIPKLNEDNDPKDDNILLEVEGQHIEVNEKCLVENSIHFSRIFEDISLHADSEYLTEDEDEEEDEEEDTDNPLAQISFATMKTLVNYISKVQTDLQLSEGNVKDFQKTARLLNFPAIEKTCQRFVEKGLNCNNCVQRYQLADSFLGWADTSKLVENYIQENIMEILENSRMDALLLNEHQMERILSCGNTNFRKEDDALTFLMDWVNFDVEQRAKLFTPLLECIQLVCLENHSVLGDLLQNKLVQQDPVCIELVDQALEYHRLTVEEKVEYWRSEPKPSRWPAVLVCLSYAEKILEYFDFHTKEWEVLTEKPDWVFGAELIYCSNHLYTIGGVSSRQVDRYDPETDEWTAGSWPSLKRPRLAHGVCAVTGKHGGTIYTAGGSAEVGGRGHSDLESICPDLPSECECNLCGPFDHLHWELEASKMEKPRTFTSMVSEGKNIYMVAGDEDPDRTTSSMEIFNMKTKQLRSSTSTAVKRDSCRLALLEDTLVAVGGHDNTSNQFLSSCEKYNIKTEKWSNFPKMKVARRSPGVVTYKGKIYCVGGMGSKKDLSSIEFFSPVLKKWTLLPNHMKKLSGWMSATLLPKPVRMLEENRELDCT